MNYICSNCSKEFILWYDWYHHGCECGGPREAIVEMTITDVDEIKLLTDGTNFDCGYNAATLASARVLEEIQSENRFLQQMTRGCPCLYVDPCHDRCACIMPLSSSGCSRCCLYGSLEQRTAMAKRLTTGEPITSIRAAAERLARFSFVHFPFPIELRVQQHADGFRGQLDVMVTVNDVCGNEGRTTMTFDYPFKMPIYGYTFNRFVDTAIRETLLHELYESLRHDGVRWSNPHERDGSRRMFTDIERYA